MKPFAILGGNRPVTIQTFQLAAPGNSNSSSSSKKLLPAYQMQKIKMEPGSSGAQPRQIKLEPGVTQPLPAHAHQPLKLEIQETFLDTGEYMDKHVLLLN
jgi:hypothetical protein